MAYNKAGIAICIAAAALANTALAGSEGHIECEFVKGEGVTCWHPNGDEPTHAEAEEAIEDLKAERAAARAERLAQKEAEEQAQAQAVAEAAAALAAEQVAAAQAAAEAAIAAAHAAVAAAQAAPELEAAAAHEAAEAEARAAEEEARQAEEAEEETERGFAAAAANALAAPAPAPRFVAARPRPNPDAAKPRIFGTTWDARVQVVATAETWVVISGGDGQEIFSGIVRPGDTILIPNRHDVVMAAGNNAALNIMVDGTTVQTRKSLGAWAINVSLAAGVLLVDEFLADIEKLPNRIMAHALR